MPTKKLITLSSDEIAGKLDQEENMSAVVEAVLSRHYNISIEGEGAHIDKRREVLDTLDDQVVPFEENVPEVEPDSGNDLIQEEEPVLTTSAGVDTSDFVPVGEVTTVPAQFEPVAVEAPVEEPTPEPLEVPVENPVENLPEYVDEVVPVEVSDPSTNEPIVEAVAEESPVAEGPAINVLGQAGGQCEIHGLFIGSICIDCL